MNEKFFLLSQQKRQQIIDAGYRVFSENCYKKSPMGEVAAAAGISKSLLFYYFQNKKEFYLFLWDEAAKVTIKYLQEYGCYEKAGLFEMIEYGMQAKMRIMKAYPEMSAFVIKAYYENLPEISVKIQESYQSFINMSAREIIDTLNPSDFKPGIDLNMMYKEMLLATEGYLWEAVQRGGLLDPRRVEQDFSKLISFWKQIYLKHG